MTDETTTARLEERFSITENERTETTLELQGLRKGVRPLHITHTGGGHVGFVISTVVERNGGTDGTRFRVFRPRDELHPLAGDEFRLQVHGMIYRINPAAVVLGNPGLLTLIDQPPKKGGGSEFLAELRRDRLYAIDCASKVVPISTLGTDMDSVDEDRQAQLYHHMHEQMSTVLSALKDNPNITAGQTEAEDQATEPDEDDGSAPLLRVAVAPDGTGWTIATNQLSLVGVAVGTLRAGAEHACREWMEE